MIVKTEIIENYAARKLIYLEMRNKSNVYSGSISVSVQFGFDFYSIKLKCCRCRIGNRNAHLRCPLARFGQIRL